MATAADPNTITFEKSSNVVTARFDPETKVCEVQFRNGAVHRFGNFSHAVMDEWRTAKSAGTWFHSNVKQQPDEHPPVMSPSVVPIAAPTRRAVTATPPLTLTPPAMVAAVAASDGAAVPVPTQSHMETELALARHQTNELKKLADFVAAKCPDYTSPGGGAVDTAIVSMTKLLAENASLRARLVAAGGKAEPDAPRIKAAGFRPWRRDG